MFYRIIRTPPGYPASQQFFVGAYESAELESARNVVRDSSGQRFAATIEEARQMIPADARRVPFESTEMFVEVWLL